MADKIRISQFAYSKIERGKTQLNWDKLNKIAQLLEINIWDLVDNTKLEVENNPAEKNFLFLIDLLNLVYKQEVNKVKSLQEEITFLRSKLK